MEIQEYNPNLTEMAEEVLLGPQADILEKISQFNNRYGTNVKCTKTFRWSPGVGEQIKEAYQRMALAFDMRYSGVYYFFNRIDDRRYWHNSMKSAIIDVDSRMTNLRRQGIRFQDNTEIIQTTFDTTKEHIIQEINSVNEMFDSNVFSMGVYVNDDDVNNLEYRIEARWENPTMSIFSNSEKIVDLKLWPVEINMHFSLLKHLNQAASDARRVSLSIRSLGNYLSPADTIKFPYFSMWTHRPLGTICWGSLQGDIEQAALKFNLVELAILLNQWVSRYDTSHTHPHNQPHVSYAGVPSWLTRQPNYETYRSLQPRDTAENCGVHTAISDLPSGKQSYAIKNDTTCDDIDCALRDRCSYYNRVVNITEERLFLLSELDNQLAYFTPDYYDNLNDGEEIDLYTIAFMNRDNSIETLKYQMLENLEDNTCPHGNDWEAGCAACDEAEMEAYAAINEENGDTEERFNPEQIAEEAMTVEEQVLRWREQQIERNNNR